MDSEALGAVQKSEQRLHFFLINPDSICTAFLFEIFKVFRLLAVPCILTGAL